MQAPGFETGDEDRIVGDVLQFMCADIGGDADIARIDDQGRGRSMHGEFVDFDRDHDPVLAEAGRAAQGAGAAIIGAAGDGQGGSARDPDVMTSRQHRHGRSADCIGKGRCQTSRTWRKAKVGKA